MMKRLRNIFLLAAICSLGLSCVETTSVEFGSEEKDLHVGPDASVQTIRIKSEQAWTAVVQVPWITVSPANGKGSAECKVMIDSALATTPREAKIFIDNLETGETLEFNVTQQGYEQVIKVSRPEIVLEDFAAFDKRYFEVEVEANVAFRLNIDATGTAWVEPKNIKDNTPVLNLDRGARPRKVKMRFDWKINSTESERETVINLDPIDPDVMIAEQNKDNIMLKQNAPEKIVEGVQGDSLALLAMSILVGRRSAENTPCYPDRLFSHRRSLYP